MNDESKLLGWTVFVASVSSSLPYLYTYARKSISKTEAKKIDNMAKRELNQFTTPPNSPHHHDESESPRQSPLPTPLSMNSLIPFEGKSNILNNKSALDLNSASLAESLKGTFRMQVLTGNQVVSNVGYAFSDMNFVFPLTSFGYIGGSTLESSHQHEMNIFGEIGRSHKLLVRSGSGGAVEGALTYGALATSYVHSEVLPLLTNNITKLASKRVATVFHVSSAYINKTSLQLTSDMTDVASLKDSGAVILISSNVQESHDMAVVAHLLSLSASIPVVHTIDGVITAQEATRVCTLDAHALSTLINHEHIRRHRKRVLGGSENTLISISKLFATSESILSGVGNIVGRQYKPFEYIGASDATVVIIIMGSSSLVVEQTISKLVSRDGAKFGVLRVRLYRPWGPEAFLNLVPSTVSKIVVLEQITKVEKQSLLRDVLASFAASSRSTPIKIIGNVYSQLVSENVAAILFNVLSSAPLLNVSISELPLIASSSSLFVSGIEIIPVGTVQSTFWGTSEDELYRTPLHVLDVLTNIANLQGSSFTSIDTYHSHGVSHSNLRYGPYNLHGFNFDVSCSEYIFISSMDILLKYDVLKTAVKHAVVVLNTAAQGEELNKALPSYFKYGVANKSLQLFTVDATHASESAGVGSDGISTVLTAVYLRFAGVLDSSHSLALYKQGLKEGDLFSNDPVGHSRLVDETLELVSVVEYPSNWRNEIGDNKNSSRSDHVTPFLMGLTKVEEALSLVDGISTCDEDSVVSNESSGNISVASVYNQSRKHQVYFNLMFPKEFSSEVSHRPAENEKSWLVPLTKNQRLTPSTYDRNVFHLEFDITGTDLTYRIGDALGVYAPNDEEEVEEFLSFYELNGDELVSLPHDNLRSGLSEIMSTRQLLTQYLDIFGRPSKRFYKTLVDFATDHEDKYLLAKIADAEYGSEEFKKRLDDTYTFADVLYEFKSARPSLLTLLELIPPIKRRHYSIASSQKMHPTQVHLLVVLVEWETKSGKKRQGQATKYLSRLLPSSSTQPIMVSVSVMPSVLRLPPIHSQPVIMAGLGTGMAPFRAFIEERAYLKQQGENVGPMILYFGSRNRANEWLYGEELEKYEREGLVTLRLAFSRDQKQKIYIQHRIEEDALLLNTLLNAENKGHFYLCGPTWPVPDIEKAMMSGFSVGGNLTKEESAEYLETLKSEGRHVLEVY